VEALVRITEAQPEGVKFGSQKINFIPKKILSGIYQFEIKTAGSVTLLLQAIFLPLCLSEGISKVTLIGGTHVQWNPPFHYFSGVLLPTLEKMKVSAQSGIEKWGFYPKEDGKIHLTINPVRELKSITLVDKGLLKEDAWDLGYLKPSQTCGKQTERARPKKNSK
jgi:RNA 3'-terminal phosphate cyclase